MAGVSVVVLGTGVTDRFFTLGDGGDEPCQCSNPASGGIWVQHRVADNGAPGNRTDGTGVRELQLFNISTALPTQTYPNNSNIFGTSHVNFDPRGLDALGRCYLKDSTSNTIYRCAPGGGIPDFFNLTADLGHNVGIIIDGSGNVWGADENAGSVIKRASSINYVAHTCAETATTGSDNVPTAFLRGGDKIAGRIYFSHLVGGSGSINYIDTVTLTATVVVPLTAGACHVSVIGDDGNIYTIDTNKMLRKYDPDGTLLASLDPCPGDNNARDVSIYDSNGVVWISGRNGGFDLIKVNAATMTVMGTVSNAGTSPMTTDWFHVIAEPVSGTIALDYAADSGGLGVVFGPSGRPKVRVTLALPDRLSESRRPLSTFLGKVHGAPTPPPEPDDKGPRCLLALRFNEKWFFASQGKNLTMVAGGFQNGTPAIFGTDGQNIWRLFTAPDREIKSRIQTACWPMKKPTHMKEGLKAGVEVTTPSSPNVLSVMLNSDFGNIAAQFNTSNAVVWVNNVGTIIPWVNFLGDVIPFGASGFLIYQGDAGFKGRYLGYTIDSNSPGYAVNGFLVGFQLSTPWAVKAQT